MRIVFGWNNFKIKDFDPYELSLTNNVKTDFKIEVRQSYFHLVWIPFFGLGKKWVIRKDGKLYELPAVYINIIKQNNIKVKSPWYTFSGLILILVCMLGYFCYEKYELY